MLIGIEIYKVMVISREHGTDKVIVFTNNMPATVSPYDEPMSFVFDVAKGKGEQYVIDNFKIQPICVVG